MAIEILNELLINGNTYSFNIPTWLANSAINMGYDYFASGMGTLAERFDDVWRNYTTPTFPFKYNQWGNNYTPSNPAGTIIQTGVSGSYIKIESQSPPSALNVYVNNTLIAGTPRGGGNTHNAWAFFFGIDRDTQEGFVYRYNCGSIQWPTDGNMTLSEVFNAYSGVDRLALYNFLIGLLPQSYNWQSVPSINGKNGILSLSTLNDINDGEEVITDDTSKFNLTNESNTLTLVRNNLPN